MSVSPRLREFLERHGVAYQVVANSAPDPAPVASRAARHPGPEAAKVTVIRRAGGLSLAVLPGQSRVDFERLGAALREETVAASRAEIVAAFPDYDPGAIPPFGVLDGIKTYLDESLTHDRRIAFHAGTRDAVVRMSLDDYRRLAAPVVLWFAEAPARAED